ncbi:MAG TPA: cation-translocating P-type ATPase, partial [Candidatus Nanoarchaeia archaeon]|nr:cation-translocating P-type ATPase [Candidatus Nanoarchaeia archaeon]
MPAYKSMMSISPKSGYHAQSAAEVISLLKTSEQGLTSSQAEQKIYAYGFNELKKVAGPSPLKIILSQFASPLVWILVVAIIISLFLRERIDALVIGIIVIINTILGFIQEYKAEKAIDALKKLSSPKARVFRDGKEILIESRRLVPGDVIVIREGDFIAADARLIQANSLKIEQASLTGESQAAGKSTAALDSATALADRSNMVYSSTLAVSGNGQAVVTATGMDSEIGRIAALIQESPETTTPLQKKLRQLGAYLTIAVIAVAAITFLAGVLRGQDWSVMILTAIALAVAAIPEGLPAVITVSLALGVQKMIQRHALVRKLPAVETLGSVTVICTDKTGTLTHNQMTVKKILANHAVYDVSGSGYSANGEFLINSRKASTKELELLLKSGVYCNNSRLEMQQQARKVIGDPTEAALLVSAEKAGIKNLSLKRVKEIPFSAERKMMTTIHQQGDKIISFSKGAVEIILEKCDKILINGKIRRLERSDLKNIYSNNESFAKEALRVLAFAYNDKLTAKDNAEQNMTFLGLQAMIDPPREEVKESIKKCQAAGIRVIMITGDHLLTAQAIAAKLNLEGKAVTGRELAAEKIDRIIEDTNIFARVEPVQKLDLIAALKKKGHIIAMTGDGVNDAPALKKADIGISMGLIGTDVAKEASDIILTDDNFASIVNAIEEGRTIFDNIRKFVNYLLSSNLAEILVIFLALLLGLPLPLTVLQILWINLVTDGLPAIALTADPAEKEIMSRPPRPPKENIISKEVGADVIILGTLMAAMALLLFFLYRNSPLAKAQTIVFTALVVFEITRLELIRARYKLPIF